MSVSLPERMDPAGSRPGEKGLTTGALGFVSNVVIGVASTAPGYSLAASLGFVVAVTGVGLQAPAILLVSFLPMLFIAAAYYSMNRAVRLDRALGLMIAFPYGLTGFACAVFTDPANSESGDSWLGVGPPLIIGVGSLVLGAFLMVLWWATGHRESFRRRTEVAPPDLLDGRPAA